jgi:hypothetical protein
MESLSESQQTESQQTESQQFESKPQKTEGHIIFQKFEEIFGKTELDDKTETLNYVTTIDLCEKFVASLDSIFKKNEDSDSDSNSGSESDSNPEYSERVEEYIDFLDSVIDVFSDKNKKDPRKKNSEKMAALIFRLACVSSKKSKEGLSDAAIDQELSDAFQIVTKKVEEDNHLFDKTVDEITQKLKDSRDQREQRNQKYQEEYHKKYASQKMFENSINTAVLNLDLTEKQREEATQHIEKRNKWMDNWKTISEEEKQKLYRENWELFIFGEKGRGLQGTAEERERAWEEHSKKLSHPYGISFTEYSQLPRTRQMMYGSSAMMYE